MNLVMRLLCFQARHFRWKTHSKTLPEVPDLQAEEEIADSVVIFVQAEAADTSEQHLDSIRRKAVKQIKWLANKRDLKNVVLHSFTHLGGDTAEPGFAEPLIQSIADRLNQSGYQVHITPFGYFCEWDLSVYGESLAKVWKEIH
jgi:transcriptional regulator of aromatic amino acid metabolism